MNTVAHQRLLNLILGTIMMVFGIGFMAGATYVYKHPQEPYKLADLVPGDVQTCQATLVGLGHKVTIKGPLINAERASTDFNDAQSMLETASLGISACGLPLASFCMGPGCSTKGVTFSLETKVPATSAKAR